MTVLMFTIPTEVSPRSVLIDNWRYMAPVNYNFGNNQWTQGTKIVLQDQTIDVMGVTPPMIRDIIYGNQTIENVIFTLNGWEAPAYCYPCGGRGIVDWISSAMNNPRPRGYGKYARLYERDEKIVMFYKDDVTYNFNKVFSRVKEEPGYRICRNCKGTGLALDARHRIFSGMPGLKRKLKALEWDGRNIPS